jgi:hypothetical protein
MNNKSRAQFIIEEIYRKPGDRPLVILMTSTHPMTDKNLCETGHHIYNLDIPNFPIKWQKEHSVPKNMTIINSLDQLPHRPDVILSQNIVDQYNIWANLQFQFDCPLVSFEHTLPTDAWVSQKIPEKIKIDLANVTRVFITEFSKREWQCGDDPKSHVIYHMVDTEKWNGWVGGNKKSMILVNQFSGREWAVGNVDELLTKNIKMGGKEIDLFGHNPGFQRKHLFNNQVVEKMQEYDVFINTSVRSPLPASLLEAASVGMPIISAKTCAIPDFFEHNKNILFYSTFEECIELNKMLLEDKKLRKSLGAEARNVILEKFNKDRYVKDWNNVLNYARENY